jgi:hypothetical protein
VLALAKRSDGTTLPWAIRSGTLTYVGEIPFTYMIEEDRYLAFADLLFDALAPATPERHRVVVRLEDINPSNHAAQIQASPSTTQFQRSPPRLPADIAARWRTGAWPGIDRPTVPAEATPRRPRGPAAAASWPARGGAGRR